MSTKYSDENTDTNVSVCKSGGKRVIYYYQTLDDLEPILSLNPQPVTHLILAAIHFGIDPDTDNPYIHLNNYPPTDPRFNNVWKQLAMAKNTHGINIRLMIGGAGGAYNTLFNDYGTYYQMLLDLLKTGPAAGLVSGVDLDVEEPVILSNIQMLMQDLHADMPGLKFTMAPVARSMYTPGASGMGGFEYKKLLETQEGQLIEWFNCQFYYGDFDLSHFDQTIQTLGDLISPSQIVMGAETGQWAPGNWQPCYDILKIVANKYGNMGGAFYWEYSLRPDNWETNVANAISRTTGCIDTSNDTILDIENMDTSTSTSKYYAMGGYGFTNSYCKLM